jgi:hypothetical protein
MESDSARIEFDYIRQVGSLSQQSLINFYENLAYELTISIRFIWADGADEGLNDSQKVERMKWINEVMHRVVRKIAYLSVGINEWSEADTWDMMQHYISLCPDISGHIRYAIVRSYESVDRPGSVAQRPPICQA